MKHKKRINPEKMISFLILSIFSLLFVIPIIWVFLSAFKVDAELNRAGGFLFLPKTWTLQNFKEVLDPQNVKVPIYKWFGNSILISSAFTGLSVVIVSMAAYAYGKLKFKGRDTLFLTILFISSFPAIVNIVPLYHTMRLFRWVNTHGAHFSRAGGMLQHLSRKAVYDRYTGQRDRGRQDRRGGGCADFL